MLWGERTHVIDARIVHSCILKYHTSNKLTSCFFASNVSLFAFDVFQISILKVVSKIWMFAEGYDFWYCIVQDIGWVIKRISIWGKKKCTKKWKWPRRELKTWYMCNNIMVDIFTKNVFLMLLYTADMAIWMLNFDNFDIDQISSKLAQR